MDSATGVLTFWIDGVLARKLHTNVSPDTTEPLHFCAYLLNFDVSLVDK